MAWVPLIPYFFTDTVRTAFTWGMILSGLALGAMGFAKAKISNTSYVKGVGEFLLLGIVATIIGYFASAFAAKMLPGLNTL